MLASLALLALEHKDIKVVHIVTPTLALSRRDESDFRLFFLRGVKNSGKVEYHTDLRFKPKQGELVLVDEADLFMYEQFVTFFIMVK